MPGEMTEDRLVQQTTAEYFRDVLGWNSVYAYNDEVLGSSGTLGRKSQKEIVLVRYLRQALVSLNPDLPDDAYDAAVKKITETSIAKSTLQINQEKYGLFKDGMPVSFRNSQGHIEKKRLKVFDFEEPDNNHFLVVRELWVKGALYRRRPDIMGFVNGIPLLFIELKNVYKDIRRAYNENLSDYKDTIPHIFEHNALIVLSNGDGAKVGSLSSKYEHFHEWNRLSEDDLGVVDFETLLKGMCSKQNFLDIFENFILFDESSGKLAKIVARNHQFLGVNQAVESVTHRKDRGGQLGVFWHTQGSGKSYSMAFFSQKIHRKLTGNFTFLIVTDREDLDTQLYKTFAGCGIVDNDRDLCRAASGKHLVTLLKSDKPYVFTMIHKFNQEVDPEKPYSARDDIIVISDEAHRTQYGRLALNMRDGLPNAHYIGFTGTPLFKNDEITRRIFGEYVSTYDFQRAVEDKATVPIFYDNRGEKLKLTTTEINEKLAEKLEQLEQDFDQDQLARLEADLSRDYHIITAGKRLDAIARDFVQHYTTRWETGKAMVVSIDKVTAVRIYNLVQFYWQEEVKAVRAVVNKATDEQEEILLRRKLAWMEETEMAVVVSEEQGEVARFKAWDLDIIPHRERMKNGFEVEAVGGQKTTIGLDLAFKNESHPFRIVFVCAMWLTGFDVPSLATLYLDKPLRAHTLMQAIARANRVHEGKNNGLIVDYCGILKNLREALATFAGGDTGGGSGPPLPPVKPEEDLLDELAEAITLTKNFVTDRGFKLDVINEKSGFEKIAAIRDAKEVINQSEETRKRFEILARVVFIKFKACLTITAVHAYKQDYSVINVVYQKLQEDREKADISEVIRELHTVVDEAIGLVSRETPDDYEHLYDISKVDFEKLKEEFQKSPTKNTTVQSLKDQIEKKLKKMLAKNPLRTDFNTRYQEIIAGYNLEKDRVIIEETFAKLWKFVEELDEEDSRAVREELDEEYLALFDLLMKKNISNKDRERIKLVAMDLLDKLKTEKLNVDQWREKEGTKAAVKLEIYNFLYNDQTGLPIDSYTPEEVEEKTELVFGHIFMQYEDAVHNAYA